LPQPSIAKCYFKNCGEIKLLATPLLLPLQDGSVHVGKLQMHVMMIEQIPVVVTIYWSSNDNNVI
jgi:hypothetical protein